MKAEQQGPLNLVSPEATSRSSSSGNRQTMPLESWLRLLEAEEIPVAWSKPWWKFVLLGPSETNVARLPIMAGISEVLILPVLFSSAILLLTLLLAAWTTDPMWPQMLPPIAILMLLLLVPLTPVLVRVSYLAIRTCDRDMRAASNRSNNL